MLVGSVFAHYSWYTWISPIWIIFLGLVSWLYVKKLSQGFHFQLANRQTIYFFTAILLIYIVKGSPFSIISNHYLFSAHIFQLAVLFFVAAPLLILSLPPAFIREQLWKHKTKMTLNILHRPWVIGILFSIGISVYIMPPVFNWLQQNSIIMGTAQLILMLLTLIVWWEIIVPLPEKSKLSHLMGIFYIFLLAMLLMPIGFYLLLAKEAAYPAYTSVAGTIIPALTAVYDQQLAGGILKGFQLGSYLFAVFLVLRKWYKEEEAREGEIDDENIRIARGVVIHLDDRRK